MSWVSSWQEWANYSDANRWQLLRFVVLPSALPESLTGVHIGLGVGWSMLVAAEPIARPGIYEAICRRVSGHRCGAGRARRNSDYCSGAGAGAARPAAPIGPLAWSTAMNQCLISPRRGLTLARWRKMCHWLGRWLTASFSRFIMRRATIVGDAVEICLCGALGFECLG